MLLPAEDWKQQQGLLDRFLTGEAGSVLGTHSPAGSLTSCSCSLRARESPVDCSSPGRGDTLDKVGKYGSKDRTRDYLQETAFSHQVASSTMKRHRTWCEVLISLFLMKLRLAAQPIPTPENTQFFSKKILSSSLSCLEAQAAAENKIKQYYSVI